MKCPNCGFEFPNGSFCPNCGFVINDPQVPNADDKPLENPYEQTDTPVQPPVQIPQQPTQAQQPIQFTQQPVQPQQPIQFPQQVVQPQQPIQYPQQVVQVQQPAKKTALHVLIVLLCVLVSVIIVAGIVVTIISSIKYGFSSDNDYYYGYVDEELGDINENYGNFTTYGSYDEVMDSDEVFECEMATLSLKKVTLVSDKLNDENYSVYGFTVEITNTTDKNLYLTEYSNILNPDNFEYIEFADYIYSDTPSSDDYLGSVIKPGESACFSEFYKFPKKLDKVVFEITFSDSREYKYDIHAMYNFDLDDAIVR